MELKGELKAFLRGETADDIPTLVSYSHDASIFEVNPRIVVFPKDTEDIKDLIRFINSRKGEKLSLTARAAGTDMSGGPLGESIILDLKKYFNKTKEVKDDYAVVEPGVYYRDFERETLAKNLLLPSYPASREICTVGGMVANNSGGEKSLVYGKTDKYVNRLKVVLGDGNEYVFAPLDSIELEKKKELSTFEGDIYRRIHKLFEDNFDAIQKAKPNVSKNSAGYNIWNVWDRKTFNLAKLFVGSQGTLGIITEINFKLIHPKPHATLLVIFVNDLKTLVQVINQVMQYKPESFEAYDDHTLRIAVRYFWEVLHYFKTKNLFKLGWQFLPEFWMTLSGGLPKFVLIAEFTGEDIKEIFNRANIAEESLKNLGVKTRITRSEDEARKYWVIRRESFNLLRHHLRGKRTAPFVDDIIVHIKDLPEFLPEVEKVLDQFKLTYTVAGHVGDANFHIIPLMDLSDPEVRKSIFEISPKIYDIVLRFGGSITGEHNDGIIRTPYIKEMYGEKIYDIFQEIKAIFDPHNIFNPGKKVGGSLEYAIDHMQKK